MTRAQHLVLRAIADATQPLNDTQLDRVLDNLGIAQIRGQNISQAKRSAAASGLIERGTDGRWRLTAAGRRAIGRSSS